MNVGATTRCQVVRLLELSIETISESAKKKKLIVFVLKVERFLDTTSKFPLSNLTK